MFERTEIEVTSASRPDPRWVFTDAAGHVHRWHVNGQPATDYDHLKTYTVPTLVRVDDEPLYGTDGEDEYGEEYLIKQWHHECAKCHAVVEPGTCADTVRQFLPGLNRASPFTITITPETPEALQPYMDALFEGTTILVAHPQAGYRFNVFITSITTHCVIGRDTPDSVDIACSPTGPPI